MAQWGVGSRGEKDLLGAHHAGAITTLGLGLEGRPFHPGDRRQRHGLRVRRAVQMFQLRPFFIGSDDARIAPADRFSPGSSPSPARRSWLTSLSPGLTFLKFTNSAKTNAKAHGRRRRAVSSLVRQNLRRTDYITSFPDVVVQIIICFDAVAL